MKFKNQKSLADMSTTEAMAMSCADVMLRIQTKEWSLADFESWMEDKLNYTFGDAYEEGYDMAESISRYRNNQ
jgi:hypothetical protein